MNARILVVDDEQLIVAMLSALLSSEGYETMETFDALAACAVLEKETPDVILCDLAMPVMDGFAMLQWVRRNPRLQHVPFVIITALSEIENRTEAFRLGADDFVAKPFDTLELLAKVDTLAAKAKRRECRCAVEGKERTAEFAA